MSNSHLDEARRTVARAAAPEGGGKDPNLVLMVIDGTTGTLDPAFDAHVLPIYRWAQAWFKGWQSQSSLTQSFEQAVAKIQKTKGSWWGIAAGPTAGLIVTMSRIKWVYNGPYIFVQMI
jgi:hypothetical protein